MVYRLAQLYHCQPHEVRVDPYALWVSQVGYEFDKAEHEHAERKSKHGKR